MAPLTLAGVARAAAGGYLGLLAAATFFERRSVSTATPSQRLVVLVQPTMKQT